MIGQSGIRDWKIQRFTAIFLGLYILFLGAFFIQHPTVPYDHWRYLFSQLWMQVASLFAILSVALHAWIGLWTILTDYIKPVTVRYILQSLILFALFGYSVWGIFILWGN